MVQRAKPVSSSLGLSGALLLSALASGGCASTAPNSSAASAASKPGESAQTATTGDSFSHGGASLFVVHLMSDFDGFRKYFEAGASARALAGVKGHLLTRLDDGRVVVHLFADDAEKVQEALKSPEMERYLDRKGTPESSLVWLTENELVKLPETPPAGDTFSLFLKLRVTDFAVLEQGFKESAPLYAEHEVIGEGLHRSTSKEDIAILHFVGTSRAKLETLAKSREFAELLARAGSQEEPKPLLGVDVSRSRPSSSDRP